MTVSANNGNTDLDYARQINAFEADPKATPGYETQFLAAKAQFLGNQGTNKPFPSPLTPIHLTPDSPSPFVPIHLIPDSSPFAPIHLIPDSPPQPAPDPKLLDPNVEPQFNVPGVTATMGVPSNFNLFPGGDPSPADVDQHAIGDCYLDAVLGSLAAQNPTYVKNMVQANADGTYTVHLFDLNGNRVDVTVNNQLPMDSKGNLVGVCGPNNQANWASIVEKAVAKYNDVYHGINYSPTDVGYAALNNGVNDDGFYEILTGINANYTPSDAPYLKTPEQQDAFALQMHDAINNGQTVWASSTTFQTMPDGNQIEGAHQYSVIDVNQDANGNWYVDVRNPWGHTPTIFGWDDGKQDGVIRMSIHDYLKYMSEGTSIGDRPVGSQADNGGQPPNKPSADGPATPGTQQEPSGGHS